MAARPCRDVKDADIIAHYIETIERILAGPHGSIVRIKPSLIAREYNPPECLHYLIRRYIRIAMAIGITPRRYYTYHPSGRRAHYDWTISVYELPVILQDARRLYEYALAHPETKITPQRARRLLYDLPPPL